MVIMEHQIRFRLSIPRGFLQMVLQHTCPFISHESQGSPCRILLEVRVHASHILYSMLQ